MSKRCIRLDVSGQVQGVGFRPHSAKLALQYGLSGWVCNSEKGVIIEVEGSAVSLANFASSLCHPLPALARIDGLQSTDQQVVNHQGFAIRDSATSGIVSSHASALIAPDAATCRACLREMSDKDNRRFRHPFICCTHCGPRYSVTQALPYDRSRTSMAEFDLCHVCKKEYTDPDNRRFHAQANCCPQCGPRLTLLNEQLKVSCRDDEALLQAAAIVRRGKIVAIKGLGGYQLLVDARNEEAVRGLRKRKRRPDKPFAVMLSNVSVVEQQCEVSLQERQVLEGVQAPIVLLQPRRFISQASLKEPYDPIAESVAPDCGLIGCMLPHTPVHHLLMQELGFPVVVTSANPADLPLISDEQSLPSIVDMADAFLVHDRAIVCPLDDSVVRVIADRPLLIRAARGYTPITLPAINSSASQSTECNERCVSSVLALGGQQKSTLASVDDQRIVVGPHRGSLETVESRQAFSKGLDHFISLHRLTPMGLACDVHPDYYTTQLATELSGERALTTFQVQHHLAHVMACMVDNRLDGPVLGVAWDGTGYSADGIIRGGEFMMVDSTKVVDVASLKTFALPGGEQSIKEPRRSALGAVYELLGESVFNSSKIPCRSRFSIAECKVLQQMLEKGIRSPRTSSVGRMFDAIASLLGLVERSSYEAQAALSLEAAAMVARLEVGVIDDVRYAVCCKAEGWSVSRVIGDPPSPMSLDWTSLLQSVLDDLQSSIPVSHIAMKVHTALADSIVSVAQVTGIPQLVLSGGCFQNRLLTELSVQRLESAGFTAHCHRNLPCNDGSLSVGQAVWAQRCHAAKLTGKDLACA